MDIKGSVQNQFGPVAANYASSAVHASGPDLIAMLEAASLRGGERVLDAGCGAGHTALAFATGAGEVIGVDLTIAMLAQAKRLAAERNLTNTRFERGDVERLGYDDASFDIVTSRYSAHHYPHPAAAVREFARVLKPGGTLLLVDVISPDPPAADTFLNAIELLRDPSHVRDHTASQWVALCSEAGMRAEVVQTWPLRLEFESWVARMNTPFLAITQIRALIDGAPREVRSILGIDGENNYSFTVPTMLLRAVRDNQ